MAFLDEKASSFLQPNLQLLPQCLELPEPDNIVGIHYYLAAAGDNQLLHEYCGQKGVPFEILLEKVQDIQGRLGQPALTTEQAFNGVNQNLARSVYTAYHSKIRLSPIAQRVLAQQILAPALPLNGVPLDGGMAFL